VSTGPHFFVSYARPDQAWAEWIAWTLEEAHFRVLIQAWDFAPGSNWLSGMQAGVLRAERTVVVLSADYAASVYGAAEWQAAWAADPTGQARKLLTVRVADCDRPGLLNQMVSVDIFGVEEAAARADLLRAARLAVSGERGKPAEAPPFPVSQPFAVSQPVPALPAAARAIPAAVPFPSGLPAVWSVPWPRNPLFTGRDGELADLAGRLSGGDGSAVVLPQALYGLGGVGKTQLAVEYAYRHAADYDLVWWVPGESAALAVSSLVDLARRAGVSSVGGAQQQIAGLVEVLRRGEQFPRWLVVVDNAEAPSELFGLLAIAGRGGQVLVTSRDPAWAGWTRSVEVDVLPHADAVRLLRRRCERLTEADADRLATALGDLPLAVEQAAGWLATTGMAAETYERLLADRTKELLTRGQPAHYPLPVAAAWTIAVDRLDDPGAVDLLRLLAQFGPEPVPLDLMNPIAGGVRALPGPLQDPLAFADCVETVCRLGLARASADGLVMHRLVQAVLRDHTPAEQRERYRTAARGLLIAADPAAPTDPACWPRYTLLHPHIVATGLLDLAAIAGPAVTGPGAIVDPATIVDPADGAARQLVLRLAEALRSSGDYRAAVTLARQARTSWATQLGDDHLDTLSMTGELARSLWSTGRRPAARAMEEDVLARYQRVLGDDHPDTLRAAADLARSLWSAGAYPAARAMREDLLARRRRILGDDHPDTLQAREHLVVSLRMMGEHAAARQMSEDLLARRRRILGDDHPDTLSATARLAAVLWSAGDYPAARAMQEDLLTRCRRILGDDHPDTLDAAANLAQSLWSVGDFPAARAMQEDLLVQYRRIRGDDHPDTYLVLEDLANSLADLGDDRTARRLREDVLANRRRILGDDHPDTLRARQTLEEMADQPE